MQEKYLLSEKTIEVRWTDMDSNQHVNNCQYFNYMTEARHDLLLKPFLPKNTADFILVDIGCQFKRAVTYPETLLIKQYITAVGNSSFSLLFEFYNQAGEITTIGQATLVSIDHKTHRAINIPDKVRSLFPTISSKPEHCDINILDNRSLVKHPITIHWSDCDAFEHLSNAMYFDYFSEARLATIPKNISHDLNFYFFVVATRCQFIKSIHYPGRIIIDVKLRETKRTSFIMTGEFIGESDNVLHAKGEAVIVCVDKKSLKPIAVPEILLDALS